MTNRSLLTRLDSAAPKVDDIRRVTPVNVIEKSIVENLRRLLQIRQGNSQSAPLCGLPDFSDLFLSHSNPTRSLCDGIKKMIEKYEPRLSAISVSQLPELRPGALRFFIEAKMKTGDSRLVPFHVETTMARVDHFAVGNEP